MRSRQIQISDSPIKVIVTTLLCTLKRVKRKIVTRKQCIGYRLWIYLTAVHLES